MARNNRKKKQQENAAAPVGEANEASSGQAEASMALPSSTEPDVGVDQEGADPEIPPSQESAPDSAPEALAGQDGGDEVQQLRAENEGLRKALDDKDAEIAEYKTRLAAMPGVGSNTEDLDVLQARLGQLKQQQQQADDHREKAWVELKRVIEEVSQLADSSKSVPVA